MIVFRKIHGVYTEFASWPRQAQLPVYCVLGYLIFAFVKYV